VSHIVADADPKAIVAAGELPGARAFWDAAELIDAADSQPAAPIESRVTGDSPAAIAYTSGTTGAAKGAVLTHGNLCANALGLVDAWRIASADRLLLALPLFHVHGLGNGVCCWLASGCRLRLLERFDHRAAAGEFLSFRPTLFFGVPTIYVRLLAVPEDDARQIGAAMRLFVSGSAPLPAHVFEAFRARFGHAILERYGMTETLMICSNPLEGERRPGTVGPPLSGVSIRIVGAGGVEVAAGEAGEVQVKGANVFSEYWKRPDATRDAFVDGWFRTGDIGVRSADGYVTLRGRMHDVIISGGFNIYPREIEDVLLDTAGVREAVVVGVPDDLHGEVPVAYVVTDDGVDAKGLGDRVRAELAAFKVPRAFVRVASLPRTALGKVQRHLLPAWTR
jgi:malonyl-CoA/methylmalonyl-CoA synthetase